MNNKGVEFGRSKKQKPNQDQEEFHFLPPTSSHLVVFSMWSCSSEKAAIFLGQVNPMFGIDPDYFRDLLGIANHMKTSDPILARTVAFADRQKQRSPMKKIVYPAFLQTTEADSNPWKLRIECTSTSSCSCILPPAVPHLLFHSHVTSPSTNVCTANSTATHVPSPSDSMYCGSDLNNGVCSIRSKTG